MKEEKHSEAVKLKRQLSLKELIEAFLNDEDAYKK